MPKRKTHDTREAYLRAAADKMNAELLRKETSHELPEEYYVSVMEPAGKVIGRAWPAQHDAHHMFVSAQLDDPVQLLATLLHEMIHLAVGVKNKHNAVFGAAARAVGLEGKLTATVAGAELEQYLLGLSHELGPYPHKPLAKAAATKKGGGRVKLVSPEDPGFSLYINPKFLVEAGFPKDPWGNEMEVA